jgi:predicted DNA-binding transcriptional regulator
MLQRSVNSVYSLKQPATTSLSERGFLTNNALVLLIISKHPEIRMKIVAQRLDISERAVQRIVYGLVTLKYLSIEKVGRQNTYSIASNLPPEISLLSQLSINELTESTLL